MNYEKNQMGMQLADRADYLQAEAAYQVRGLELQAALDDERAAARAFNSLLGNESETMPISLAPLDNDMLASLTLPKREALREDLKAAQENVKAASSNYQLALERNSPSLDLSGSLALNGRQPGIGPAAGDSFSVDRPTAMIGVKFTAPLDFSLLRENRRGALKQRQGAEVSFRRQLFDQEREWNELTKQLSDLKHRLELSRAIEQAQEKKLSYEKVRLRKGRTTTYQVLLFEQDYAQAQLSRINVQAEILKTIAQMKTFGGAS